MIKRFFFTTLVVTGGMGIGFFAVRQVRSQAQIRSQLGKSYTIYGHEKYEDFKTGKVLEKATVYAVRTDGSYVKQNVMLFPNGRSYLTKGIKLIPEKKFVEVHEAIESVTTTFLAPQNIRRATPHSGPDCTVKHGDPTRYSVMGYEVILGYNVVKLEFANAGQLRVQQWEAPDLDCAQLRWVAEWTDKAGRLLSREERSANSVAAGQPPAELFYVPRNYVERPPSEIMAELARRHWGECPGCLPPEKVARMNKNYYASRKFAPK